MNFNIEIKKYPFLGYSQTLMEYFAIIGYQEDIIQDILIPNYNQCGSHHNKYHPTIISSVIASVDYGMIDNDLILTQLYPDTPTIIPVSTPKPKSTSVINSFCFDTYDGKGKIFYVCYGYKFYEIYDLFYIPKSFCIISQFPFFTSFHQICTTLQEIFENYYIGKDNIQEIPIECLLYSIVNFIPSPINYNIHLDLFSHFYINSIESPTVEIQKLSGYPYVDFNLSEVFNLIPITQFIQLFFLTILEENLLFISPDLEVLNIVMYILSILNYPCNDSTYFWHIVSVSKDSLNDISTENKFVCKIMASCLGINCSYYDGLKVVNFNNPCYVYDLENQKIIYKKNKKLMTEEDIIEKDSRIIFEYIEQVLKDKKIYSKFLKKFIDILLKDLDDILKKKENFNPNQKNKSVEFLSINEEINQQNRKIQEAFYNFYLNLLMMFYPDNILNPSLGKIGKDKSSDEDESQKFKFLDYFLSYQENTTQFSEQEKMFCELFRNTVKYKIYFENFIQECNSQEMFKIPLLFSEEYINIKKRDANEIFRKNLSFFDLMDKYYVDPQFGVSPMIEVTLNNFYSTIQEKAPSLNLRCRKMKLICLDKKIMQKFVYYINNLVKDELYLIYPSTHIRDRNIISQIQKSKIQNLLQTQIIYNNLTSSLNILIYSFIFIFSMTHQLLSFNNVSSTLLIINNTIEKLDFFLRDHAFIILITFYKFLLLYKEQKNFNKVIQTKMFYFVVVNFLRNSHILPNEEMMNLIRDFNREAEVGLQVKSINDIEEDDVTFNFKDFPFKMYFTYCFDKDGTKKMENLVNLALNSSKDTIIELSNKLKPKICLSIFGKKIFSNLLTPLRILRMSQEVFDIFINSKTLDLKQPKVYLKIKELIINLILYCRFIPEIQNMTFILTVCYFLFFCEQNQK